MKTEKNYELLQKAIVQAWKDADFKKEFVANPTKAVKNLTGESLTIPEGKEFVVIDTTDDSKVYFKLPSEESIMEVELTDEQLEKVAGGAACSNIKTITVIDSCFSDCTGNGTILF